tara:strand:+ start:155 stop:460 length:306 start_codon:yes stop_codon:yes gene_type:complete
LGTKPFNRRILLARGPEGNERIRVDIRDIHSATFELLDNDLLFADGNCIAAGATLKTKDGDKYIEDIIEGDYVLDHNFETGEDIYFLVHNIHSNLTDSIVF